MNDIKALSERVLVEMRDLTDEQRVELFSYLTYCSVCGRKRETGSCRCWQY